MKHAAQLRRLSVLRHAKAAEDSDTGRDKERPLNPRGREDAQRMGEWLRSNHAVPDLVLCSTATRTRETLAALGLQVPVILSDKVYLASAGELLALVQERDDADMHILLIGHNPGLHGLIALLAGNYVREEDAEALLVKFPTCAFASMTIPAERWTALTPGEATVDAFQVGSAL